MSGRMSSAAACAVMPFADNSAANAVNSAALPAAIVSRAPDAPRVAQATLPKAPVAPTTIADLPRTSNRRLASMVGRLTDAAPGAA